MKQQKKILFLYSEMADYFLACVAALAQKAEVMVVHWPVNKEAPFQFQLPQEVTFLEKPNSTVELEKITREFQPDVTYCSGWLDKDYLNIIQKKDYPGCCITGIDTPINTRLKQTAKSWWLKLQGNPFQKAWVAGENAKAYALKLGFEEQNIFKGIYCCNTTRFKAIYEQRQEPNVTKRLLYVGRYVEQKGIDILLQAFQQFHTAHPEWELVMAGTGELFETISQKHIEGVTHLGFVQPEAMEKLLHEGGVFVLPSHFEPWGVVVQEMAVAGFPLLLSDQVNAGEAYLYEGENGFQFQHENAEDLVKQMERIAQLSTTDREKMSQKSHALGLSYTPQAWAKNILSNGTCVE